MQAENTQLKAEFSQITEERDREQAVYFAKILEVLSKSQKGDDGTVEFKAWFSREELDGKLELMHESSVFKRNKCRWYYVGGEVN